MRVYFYWEKKNTNKRARFFPPASSFVTGNVRRTVDGLDPQCKSRSNADQTRYLTIAGIRPSSVRNSIDAVRSATVVLAKPSQPYCELSPIITRPIMAIKLLSCSALQCNDTSYLNECRSQLSFSPISVPRSVTILH